MAKKSKTFSFGEVVGLTDGIIKKSNIQRHDKTIKTNRTLVPTGIYSLNAALSGDIYGGIPNNRITVLAGESGVGKSYLCYNIAREAQKQGYSIIYIDTEFAIELDQLPNYGIDIDEDKFMLLQSNVIEDLKIFLTQLLDGLKQQYFDGVELPKMLIFIDSLGQLASRKEVEDALDGKEKADMTRAKALGSMFRIINADLGLLGIGLCATNHTYETMDLFPQTVMRGGKSVYYSASNIVFLSKAKLKETEEMDDLSIGQSGHIVTAKMMKNRLVQPKKIKFEISFVSGCNPYKGLEFWCTEENFEQIGIAKGKVENDGTFVAGGNRWYIRHLGRHVKIDDFYSGNVFTKEVLDAMQPIIYDYFKYNKVDGEEFSKKMSDLSEQVEDYEEGGLTSEELFE